MTFAKECKHLAVLTQVSTAYVNCDKQGLLLEQIYEPEIDSEVVVADILNRSKEYIDENETKIVGKFPNTYTFTKNLGEKTLIKNKGHLNFCLWRPSIIASSVAEPMPGWTDSLSAAGGLSILGGVGLSHVVNSHGRYNFDVIPVDYVSNGCLVATCYTATKKDKEVEIFNCTTSVQNPMTMYEYSQHM